MLTLAFTGDVMLGRYVNELLKSITPAEMWNDLLPHLAQADLRIVNLECALTKHLQPWTRTEKMFHFRADPKAVRVLQAARIDACALANNHILDYEERGLLDTLHVLDAAGIRHAGAGANAAEAAAPAMLEVQGACALPRGAALLHRQRAGLCRRCRTSRHQLSGSLAATRNAGARRQQHRAGARAGRRSGGVLQPLGRAISSNVPRRNSAASPDA